MVNLKRLLTEAWPAWKPGMDEDGKENTKWNMAAGNSGLELPPGGFEEAGNTYDALET